MSTPRLLTTLGSFLASFLVIAALIFAVYAQTLQFGFSGLDDTEYIIPALLAAKGIAVKQAFVTGAFLNTSSEFYRPIQSLSLMLDAQFSGHEGTAYHFSNVLYHTLTCVAIYSLFILLGYYRFLSLSAAVLYAVHPLFVHTVAWIPARGDLLIGIFGILSFIFFIQYFRTKGYLSLSLHTLSVLLALSAKEAALPLPMLFLIYHYLTHRQDTLRSQIRLIAPFLVIWGLLITVYFWMRLVLLKIHLRDANFGLDPFLENLRTIPEFVGKFLLPLHLSPMPDFTIFNTVAGIIGIALLTVIIRYGHTRRVFIWFGILWFLLFTLPSLSYRHEYAGAAYNYLEQRAYLPTVGLLMVLTEILQVQLRTLKPAFFGVVAVCILSAAGYSYRYAQNYKNEMTFLTRAIVTNPKSALAYYNRGIVEAHAGRPDDAVRDYEMAIALKPNYSEAYNNRGGIRWSRRQYLEAFADFDAAYQYNLGSYEALQNRGYAKMFLFNDRQGGDNDLKKAKELERNAASK